MTNAFAERFVGTLRARMPRSLLVHSERYLRWVLAKCERHYTEHRLHRAL
ncbi:integrase core domain-containing protein [Nonomuraea sp. NPDC026600]